jgi:hypothetical protein
VGTGQQVTGQLAISLGHQVQPLPTDTLAEPNFNPVIAGEKLKQDPEANGVCVLKMKALGQEHLNELLICLFCQGRTPPVQMSEV